MPRQQDPQLFVGVMVIPDFTFKDGVPGEPVEKGKITAPFARFVGERTARQNRELAPKDVLITEDFNMPRHTDECALQGFARGVFAAGGDYQQVAPQTVEVSIEKSAPGHFISFRHRAGQHRHVRRCAGAGIFGRGAVTRMV